jgi:hypothetical protein
MHGLTDDPGEDKQEWQGQRQPPEPGGNRPDAGEAYQPRAESEQGASDQQGGKGERVGFRASHAPRLG